MANRPRYLSRSVQVIAILFLTFAGLARGETRAGDAGSVPDPARFDANWPDMKEWAQAGVRGGVPPREATKVVKTVKPGDDLQAAIDQAAKTGGGVVLLTTGTYPVNKRLDLRAGVVLRGEMRDAVVLENTMRSMKPSDDAYTVRMDGTKKAALEDLTLRHAEVAKIGIDAYHERSAGATDSPGKRADLFVGGLQAERAQDCWVDNVFILHSGSHPLNIQGEFLTVRDTLVDGAFNKGEEGGTAGSGNVYFAVVHGLFYNNTIQNVRHSLVVKNSLGGGDCKWNVILDCNFGGDVNFHGDRQDRGHNLFEGDLVRSPLSHGWPAWSYWKREQIGPENIVYKSLGWGGSKDDKFTSTEAAKVYTFTGIKDPNVLGIVERAAPKDGTLYAVTGKRPTAIEALGKWPANPTQARDLFTKRVIKSPIVMKAKK